MSDRRTLLHALLRQDLASFVHKTFVTLEPGMPIPVKAPGYSGMMALGIPG